MLPGAVIARDGYYVVDPITYPADLAGHLSPTGRVPDALLVDVAGPGRLHHIAARCHNAMVAAAKPDGFTLTYSGQQACYRSYLEQSALWALRTTTRPLAGRPSRTYSGVTYWLLTGAWPAYPGDSNHGLGLAVDYALNDYAATTSLTPAALSWLKANAWRFGFTWEYHDVPQPEKWHLRLVTGDAIPAAVLAYEGHDQPPPQPTPQEDDDVAPAVYTWKEHTARFTIDFEKMTVCFLSDAQADAGAAASDLRYALPNVPYVVSVNDFLYFTDATVGSATKGQSMKQIKALWA